MTEKKIDLELSASIGPVVVEIHRDGRISFPVDAFEYDQAMIEFGEAASEFSDFINDYDEKPIFALFNWVIFKNRVPSETALRGPDEFLSVSLILDYVEHVLPILEASYPPEKYEYKHREILKLVREYLYQEMSFWQTGGYWSMSQSRRERVLEIDIDNAVSALPNISEYRMGDTWGLGIFRSKSVSEAASAIASAVGTMYAADAGFASSAAESAVKATQHFVVEQRLVQGASADLSRFENEQSWQIRRFVDVLWAGLRDKQYPSLKSTK